MAEATADGRVVEGVEAGDIEVQDFALQPPVDAHIGAFVEGLILEELEPELQQNSYVSLDDTRIEIGDAKVGNLGAAVLIEEAIGPEEAVIQEVAAVGEAIPDEEVVVAEETVMREATADGQQVVLQVVEAKDVEVGPEGVVDPEIATILEQIYNIYQQTTLMVFCHKETKDARSKLLPRQSLLCDRYQALQMITHQRDKKPYLKLLNDWRSYEEEINKLNQ